MRSTSRSALLAMAAMASIGMSASISTVRTPSNPMANGQSIASRVMGSFFGSGRSNSPTSPRSSGPGWTNAHARRVSRKARNVKRHRASAKG